MPLDDALAILMESIYRRTGTSVANLAAINAEVRALARGYAASRLREAAGDALESGVRADEEQRRLGTRWRQEIANTYRAMARRLTERAAAEERG